VKNYPANLEKRVLLISFYLNFRHEIIPFTDLIKFNMRHYFRNPIRRSGFSIYEIRIRTLFLIFFFGLQASLSFSQYDPYSPYPAREFRGVWVTTLFHIDYPREPTTHDPTLQAQWIELIDALKQTGFNAVIVQVRGIGDAIYPSEFAPWSEYLTGQQGLAPTRNFDLLRFMVEETHKRGMEFHAWFNPYRVSMDLDTFSLAPSHIFNRRREWIVRYGGRLYLNPAYPEVWQHITDVVMEVVKRYDVDAVHFDDYFYPYPKAEERFSDRKEYLMYRRKDESLFEWRRRNVNSLIEKVSTKIKTTKPWVRFGISPFGIWRNQRDDPRGSATRAGTTSFDHLHADVRNWLEKGWVDYVMPQLYWNIGYGPADHRALVNWWASNTFNRQLIIGHAAFKVGYEHGPAWQNPAEIIRQINLARTNRVSVGSCFFSASSILDNRLGLRDIIRGMYRRPALPPPVMSTPYNPPAPPRKMAVRLKKETVRVIWKPEKKSKSPTPSAYALYRTRVDRSSSEKTNTELIDVIPHDDGVRKYRFNDPQTSPGATYQYEVSSLNRMHQESRPVKAQPIQTKRKPSQA
jgi:uncharacterized lipoprotein YddW (UPF0748 family)